MVNNISNDDLELFWKIIEHANNKNWGEAGAGLASVPTERSTTVPARLVTLAREKLHEALDGIGLGDLEIKEITLGPRGDIHPMAGFKVCCNGDCDCRLC